MCLDLKPSNYGYVLYMLWCWCRLVIYTKFPHRSRMQTEKHPMFSWAVLTMYLQPILFINIPDDKHVGSVSCVLTKEMFRYSPKSQYIEVNKSNILFMLLIRFITTKTEKTKWIDLQLLCRTVFRDMKLIIRLLKSVILFKVISIRIL